VARHSCFAASRASESRVCSSRPRERLVNEASPCSPLTVRSRAQRPLAGVALSEAAPTPAWRSRPVWAVLPTADRCIDPGVHHFSYERMGATVTEIEGASHVAMISHPKEVAQVVMTAVRACGQ